LQAAQKISEARRAYIVIVSVKRDREIRTSTITNDEDEWSEAIERNDAYEVFSAACEGGIDR